MLWRLAALSMLSATALGAPARLPRNALPVPLVAQATDYSCGAAAFLAVLYYWQAYKGTESSLYAMLGTTPDNGTEPDQITEVARLFGLEATMKEGLGLGELRAALQRGDTAILDLQAWRDGKSTLPWKDTWEEGHYAVVVGMDEEYAYVMDPIATAGYAYVPLLELLDRWHDYDDRGGQKRPYYGLGVLVHGKNPLTTVPGPLVRME